MDLENKSSEKRWRKTLTLGHNFVYNDTDAAADANADADTGDSSIALPVLSRTGELKCVYQINQKLSVKLSICVPTILQLIA